MMVRPWPLVLLAVCHFLAPVANIALASHLQNEPLSVYLERFFQEKAWRDLFFVFGVFPIAGVAIFWVRKWSYALYLGAMTLSFYSNFQNWILFPEYLSLTSLLGMYALNLAVVSYFLVPAVRLTYFDARRRWWESKPRYSVKIDATLELADGKMVDCRILDISEGGVFVLTQHPFELGCETRLLLSVLDSKIAVDGKIAHHGRSDLHGYGIEFNKLSRQKETQRKLQNLTRNLDLLGLDRRPARVNLSRDFGLWLTKVIESRGAQGLLPEAPWANARKPGSSKVVSITDYANDKSKPKSKAA